MKEWVLSVVALAPVSVSCSTIFGSSPSLTVTVPSDSRATFDWPTGSDTIIRLDNSLDDPTDMAGIEVEITGIGQSVTLDSRDFKAGVERFGVPSSGRIHVAVQLRQHGDIVAQGATSWVLEPEVEWEVELERSPYPIGAFIVMRPRSTNRVRDAAGGGATGCGVSTSGQTPSTTLAKPSG